jgi:hypothetical protein
VFTLQRHISMTRSGSLSNGSTSRVSTSRNDFLLPDESLWMNMPISPAWLRWNMDLDKLNHGFCTSENPISAESSAVEAGQHAQSRNLLTMKLRQTPPFLVRPLCTSKAGLGKGQKEISRSNFLSCHISPDLLPIF